MNSRLLKMLCITGALLSSSAFAQQQMKQKDNGNQCVSSKIAPDYALPDNHPDAQNTPAATKVSGGWDVEIDASFIYWYVNQEYMDFARTAVFQPGGATPATQAHLAQPDFGYKPGFKVGFQFNTGHDDWVARASYLWMHQSVNNTLGVVPAAMTTGQTIYIPNDWWNNFSTTTQRQAVQVSSYWKMNMDLVDLTMSRPFYQGKSLIVSPYGGVRALWIRQVYNLTATNANELTLAPASSQNRSQCWSIGPNTGAGVRYLMGGGFRFEGKMGFSLLYTRYTKLSHSETDQISITGALPVDGKMNPLSAVRPATDMGLGFGWGTYFAKNGYHVDFSASYDFSLFWSQNMMRQTAAALGNNNVGYASPAGDLMMQGLTLNAGLDF